MTAFSFNKYGKAKVDDFVPLIYSGDRLSVSKLYHKKPHPPAAIKQGVEQAVRD